MPAPPATDIERLLASITPVLTEPVGPAAKPLTLVRLTSLENSDVSADLDHILHTWLTASALPVAVGCLLWLICNCCFRDSFVSEVLIL